jgi:hypothetical protein
MAYTDIDKPNNYFNTMLYTANGAVRNITEADTFQADLVWLKRRNAAVSHHLVDSVRGATKAMYSNTTGAEATDSAGVTGFVTDGFSLGGQGGYNDTGTFVSWTWKKQAGVFDIQTYTGNGSNRTISHNLGVVPKMMIIKKRNTTAPWSVGHASLGANQVLELDATDAVATDASYWNNTRPTSSVFSVGTDGNQNTDGHTYVIYLFGDKKGMSKIGSYTGNGNVNGNFIYTGFKPAFILLKGSANTENWSIYDNKRLGYNVDNNVITSNTNAAELTDDNIDLLSNGFKIRRQTGLLNDAQNYIFMAFAEQPLVTSTGVPATAR